MHTKQPKNARGKKDIYHKCGHSHATGTIQETVERKEDHIRKKENYNIFNDITHRFHTA